MKRHLWFALVVLAVLVLAGCGVHSPQVDDRVTAFVHVNLVPMTEEIVLEDYAVLVEGRAIVAIGPAGQVALPERATVVDGAGAYLMPGLADMHVHSTDEWVGGDDWPVSPLALYLANGVTTVRDCGHTGEISLPLRWRDEIAAGRLDGPTMYTAGSVFHGDHRGEIYPGVVQEQLDQGYDLIKLRDVRSADQFALVAQEVEQAGAYWVSHVPFRVGLDAALDAGIDEMAHVEELTFETLEIDTRGAQVDEDWIVRIVEAMVRQYGPPPAAFETEQVERTIWERHAEDLTALAEEVRSAGVSVGTTLVVDDPQAEFDSDGFLVRPEVRYLARSIRESVRQGEGKVQRAVNDAAPGLRYLAECKYAADRLALQSLRKAGVPLLLGTDSGGSMPIVPGLSVHDELDILTENGFTPYQALVTATVNAAPVVEAMTGEGNVGTIQVGSRADLILVDGNPLEDLSTLRDPRGVMAAGRWYPREMLQQMIAVGQR